MEFGKSCEKYHGIIVLPHLIDLRRTGLPKEQCAEWWKEHLQYCFAIWLGWKMVGWFYGMLLLSAKCLRPPGWWESPIRELRETVASENTNPRKKTKYACVVEAHESIRKRLELILSRNHEDHIAESGFNSLTHKFILMPLSDENFRLRKQQWKRNGRSSKRFQPGSWTKLRAKKGIILEARRDKKKVHFATLIDICHLKNAEFDMVNDGSGAYVVFTERGSSASQIDCCKSDGRHCEITGYAGQAADAVSAYTQVKMEDASRMLEIPKSQCPDFWICLPRHKWSQSWSDIEDPVVPLERNFYGHPLADLLRERQFEEFRRSSFGTWMRKIPNWECLFVHRKQGLFLSVTWMTLNGWKKDSRIWLPCARNWWTCWSWQTNMFSCPFVIGMHST